MKVNCKPLILVGGGGHCRSVIDAAQSAGLTVKGILDKSAPVGTEVLGVSVIGGDDMIADLVYDWDFVVTVGFIRDNTVRQKLCLQIQNADGNFGTVIASTAYVSPYAQIGSGTVVLQHATVNAAARVGANCILNTGCVIEHDCVIGAGTHISTGVLVNGGARIGQNTFIGSGTVVNNGISVCDGVIVASGSVVTKDITEPGFYRGAPAIKYR